MNDPQDSGGRLRQIARVLARHGFSYVIDRIELKSHLPITDRVFAPGVKHISPAARFRTALEELGPTYVKLGQVLSTRPDILPPEYIEELTKLQDRVKPFSFEQVATTIEQDFGKPVSRVFKKFNETPLASASIGQVHEAWLKTGEHVVVKIVRPNITETIDHDIRILQYLAEKIEKEFPQSRLFNPKGFVEEFDRQIHREINYKLEGANVDRFGKNFAADKTVKVPAVFWKYTSKNVLTLEFIDGLKITELKHLETVSKKKVKTEEEKLLLRKFPLQQYNRKIIARRFILSMFRQVFEHRFFHADPHPGNVMVLKNNVVGYLDFGMMKVVDQEFSDNITDVFINLLQFNVDELARALLRFDATEIDVDTRELKNDLKSLLEEYQNTELGDIDITHVIQELAVLNIKYQARIPKDFFMLGKAIGTAEGICRTLDPSFNAQVVLTPTMHELVRKRMSVENITSTLKKTAASFFSRARDLPKRVDNVLRNFERGKLEFDFRHKDLHEIELEIDRSSNRLTLGIIVAAFIVASALIMQLPTGPLIFGFPAFALVGLSSAGVIGFWVAISIMKRGRI